MKTNILLSDIDEETFERSLIQKYPDLFPMGCDGIPYQPACGISCPAGWHVLVDTLCCAIDYHVKNPVKIQAYKKTYTIKKALYYLTNRLIYSKIHNLLNPYKHLYGLHAKSTDISNSVISEIVETQPRRVWFFNSFNKLFNNLKPKYQWKDIVCPNVQINQIKDKFGTLRFYFSGGDEYVRSIVSFAETMSARTCEETGSLASLYQKRGWYRTLCAECASSYGYISKN